jgi:hypothetical protein
VALDGETIMVGKDGPALGAWDTDLQEGKR